MKYVKAALFVTITVLIVCFGVSCSQKNPGDVIWRIETEEYIVSPPAVEEHIVYYCSDAGDTAYRVNAFDTENRELMWRSDPESLRMPADYAPTVTDEHVIVSFQSEGVVIAYSRSTGEKQWEYMLEQAGRSKVVAPFGVSPGMVFFCYRNDVDKTGGIDAVNTRTGRFVWRNEAERMIWAGPVVSNDTVFYGCNDGKLSALRASTGELLWEYDTGLDFGIQVPPSATDDAVYFHAMDKHLYAVDAVTGELRWRKEIMYSHYGFSIVQDDTVFVGSDKRLDAVSTEDGSGLWHISDGNRYQSGPLYLDGVVYLAVPERQKAHIEAFSAETGERLWEHTAKHDVYNGIGVNEKAVIYAMSEYERRRSFLVAVKRK